MGAVGERRPAVWLVQHVLRRAGADRPSCLCLGAREELVADAARGESSRAFNCERSEGKVAGRHDQLLACLCLELAPRQPRTLRETHVVLLGVREAEDPGAPVARTARVTDLELLKENDSSARLRERSCRGHSHDSCSHDHDLRVDRPQGGVAGYGPIPRAAFEAARESAW